MDCSIGFLSDSSAKMRSQITQYNSMVAQSASLTAQAKLNFFNLNLRQHDLMVYLDDGLVNFVDSVLYRALALPLA